MARHDYELNLKSAAMNREYDAHIARIVADRPSHVLDWGCGHGQNAKRLKDAGLRVSAFDFRPQDKGRATGLQPLPKYPDIEAFIERDDPVGLPYEDDTFDAVLSMGVLEHVGRPHDSLVELHRVLRPGGRLYVFKLPNRLSWTEQLGRRRGKYFHGELPYDRLYSVVEARRMLEHAGFDVVEARRANMLPLNVPGAVVPQLAGPWWKANRLLERVPGLNLAATNVEAIGVAR